jgi:trans-2,3-dihydro-3-hydroxyanthranilate isomerase
MEFEVMHDGDHAFWIEQGYDMNRPSQIHLTCTVNQGELRSVHIGGGAVVISNGILRI